MSDDPANDQDPSWLAEARAMHGLAPLTGEEREKPPDASDPDAAADARRKQRIADRADDTTTREFMRLREGRAWIHRRLYRMGAFRAHDFPPSSPIDPLQMARNVAQREFVQLLTNDLMRCAPQEYILMLSEATDQL